ncbi:MAG TPA: flagellin [Clostridiales bacterium]|nr:flagellin [Clostridiales bacterium]
MRINNNIMAMNTYRQLGLGSAAGARSMEKLSSGFRINRAGDDAAGLAISEKMRGQIRGLTQASRNAQDGISLIQTAEGALNETHAILQRMRELAVQSATDTNVGVDRGEIQKEVDQLAKEITRISNTTEFNTQNLLAGGFDGTFHIGANKGQNVNLSIGQMDAKALGVAGSNIIQTGGLAGNGSGIASVANLSAELEAGTDYAIDVTKTAADVGAAIAKGTGDGTAAETGSIDYTGFTGTSNTTYTIEVVTVSGDADANQITSIRVSNDGGKSWSGSIDISGGTGTFDGLVYTREVAGAGSRYAAGDQFTFTANASYADVQLQKGGAGIGDAVRVYYGATSANIGNVQDGKTLTANFKYTDLATATTSDFTIAEQESESASISNGVITKEALTRAGTNVSTQKSADAAIIKINSAIETVSAERSMLGAYQNRLEHTIKNLDTSAENLQASESRIRDVDMAKEMMEFTKNNILQQAATAMLAQANAAPQAVLQLLR